MVDKVQSFDLQRRPSGAELIRQLSQQKLGSDEYLQSKKKSTTTVKRYNSECDHHRRPSSAKLLRQHSVATTDSRRALLVQHQRHRNWRSCDTDPREILPQGLVSDSRQASLSLAVQIESDPKVNRPQGSGTRDVHCHVVDSVQHKIDDEQPSRAGDKSSDGLSRRARIVIVFAGVALLLMCLVLVGVTLRLAPLIDEIVRRENEGLLPSLTASNTNGTADATESSSGELVLNSLNVSLTTLT